VEVEPSGPQYSLVDVLGARGCGDEDYPAALLGLDA